MHKNLTPNNIASIQRAIEVAGCGSYLTKRRGCWYRAAAIALESYRAISRLLGTC
jgi:hypothetical protein